MDRDTILTRKGRRHAYATAFYGKWYLGDTKPCYPTGKIRAPVRFELAGEIPLAE